jgi:hypothetical protein
MPKTIQIQNVPDESPDVTIRRMRDADDHRDLG